MLGGARLTGTKRGRRPACCAPAGRHTPWMGIGRAARHSRIVASTRRGEPVRMDVAARCWLFEDIWRGLSHLDPSPKRLVHSLGLIHSRAATAGSGGPRSYGRPSCEQNYPPSDCKRRLGAAGYQTRAASPHLGPGATINGRRSRPRRATRRSNSLLPRWPDTSVGRLGGQDTRRSGLCRRRRIGGDRRPRGALTVFTLIRDRTEANVIGKLLQ